MTRYLLAAGVAALAISAPAAAGPHGHGGGAHAQGGGHAGGGAAMHAQGGGHAGGGAAMHARGGGHAGGGFAFRAHGHGPQGHGGGHHAQAMRAQGGGHGHAREMRQAQARPQHGHAMRSAQVQMHGHGNAHANAHGRAAERLQAENRAQVRQEMARRNAMLGRNNAPVLAVRNNEAVRAREDLAENGNGIGYGVGGCPPGLAKKPVACMPPGQARQLVNTPLDQARRIAELNRVPVRLQSVYPTTPNYYYTYGNGYAYRVNSADNVISALLPLFGAGYSVGQPFPASYPAYALPAAYQPFYPNTPYADYRYANGYVYQVNPVTGMIEAVDPMLGYGYGYGQMMPATYSAYNVPYQYRPYYYDTGNAYYRYAPGAIYQVDPTTSLITAVAALLSPNPLAVGQALPMGYSAYNVPYAYRSTYYDTPDAWYRYSNGNIYRVDPATQLVTALVASALT